MTKRLKSILGVLIITILVVIPINNANAEQIDQSQFQPILVLEPLSTEPASPDGEFYISFKIKNYSKHPAFNLSLDFNVEGADGKEPFSFMDPEGTKLEKIEGNETRNMTIGMKVKPEAQNKEYRLQFSLKCQNVFFTDGPSSTISLTIKVSYDLTKPQLLVKRVVVNPEEPDLRDEFGVEIEMENISKVEARNFTVFLDGQENFEVIDVTNKKYFKKLSGGGKEIVNYTIRTKDGRKGNNLQLKMIFDYSGDKKDEQIEQINLPIERTNLGSGKNPWVIINKYTLSADKVLAGNTVTLKLFVENTNNRDVGNVKISLGFIQVEESKGGGTVFSPINSSNSFYLDRIPGKTVMEKTIDLFIDPNATAKTYIVPVSIKYEDINGNQYTVDELVNIPVTQESKLQVISVEIPPEGFIGQPIPISSEFVNVGKVALTNFNVVLEGDFNKEDGNYYIGNLDIGASDFFQGMIFPDKEGTLSGNLVFNYVDNNNQEVRDEHPFEINVQQMDPSMLGPEPGMPGPEPDKGKEGNKVSRIKGKLALWLVTAAAVAEAIYIIKKRKKEKKSGEFFDE